MLYVIISCIFALWLKHICLLKLFSVVDCLPGGVCLVSLTWYGTLNCGCVVRLAWSYISGTGRCVCVRNAGGVSELNTLKGCISRRGGRSVSRSLSFVRTTYGLVYRERHITERQVSPWMRWRSANYNRRRSTRHHHQQQQHHPSSRYSFPPVVRTLANPASVHCGTSRWKYRRGIMASRLEDNGDDDGDD